MPTIDALMAEALCAAVGYDRLLQEKPKPLTPADVDRAGKVLDQIPKLAKRLVEGTETEEVDLPEPGDYEAEVKRLSAVDPELLALPADRVLAIVGDLPSSAMGLAYLAQAHKVITWLGKALPKVTEQTLFGPRNLEPARIDLGTYWRARDVLNDPLHVMRLACDSLLLTEEVAALKLNFPELYGAMVRATFSALADAGAREGDDWLPPKRRSVEILLEVSPVSPEFARDLQEAARAADAAAEGKGDALMPGMMLDVDTQAMATPNQRIANK